MSTLYHPHGYCVLCGAPKEHILDLRCKDCTLRSEQAYYSTATTAVPTSCYYSNSTAPLYDRDTTPELPALSSCNTEEVTSDRASRITIGIYESISEHQETCETCNRYKNMGMCCIEQVALWDSLEYWEKQIAREVAQ